MRFYEPIRITFPVLVELTMKQILLVGASGGIGNKSCQILLDQGYRVVGTFFEHPERLENLKSNPNFVAEQVDIKEPKSLVELKKKIEGEVYAIINCAGICLFEDKESDDFKIWQKTIETNMSGNYYLAKVFYPKLENNGRLVMISSTDSFYGATITSAYAASKAGVNSLTKSLSLLFQDKKILVNTIAPGWVLTPMIASNGDEFLNKVAQINPLKRNARPEDVATLINFLVSQDNTYLNGQVIPFDGGYTNQDPTLLIEEG